MLIKVDALRHLLGAIFTTAGCAADEGARIAKHLVSANLVGHDSHGVVRTQRYIEWLQEGKVNAGKSIELITDNEVMALVDGGYGFGQTVGPQAVQLGIDKARKNGVGIIGLRHSGHLGRIGDWAEMAAEANQVSIHFVNMAGSQLVAPFGGVGRRMSTNPIAVGVPMADGPPIILDFATAVVAEGKVLVAQKGGKPIPPGSLIEPDGTLSHDPFTLYGEVEPGRSPNARKGTGAIRAMGEHKGSGLSFICEILAGALTGSGCAGPGQPALGNGMLSIYLSMDCFDSDHHFAAEARQYIEFFKSSPAAEADGEVLLPGDVEIRTREQRLAEGIPLPDDAWNSILAAAERAGLAQAKIDTILMM